MTRAKPKPPVVPERASYWTLGPPESGAAGRATLETQWTGNACAEKRKAPGQPLQPAAHRRDRDRTDQIDQIPIANRAGIEPAARPPPSRLAAGRGAAACPPSGEPR